MKLKLKEMIQNIGIYEITIGDENVGSIEMSISSHAIFIENIKKSNNSKEKRLVEKVVKYLKQMYNKPIGCCPLPQYLDYYKKIGFKYLYTFNESDFYQI